MTTVAYVTRPKAMTKLRRGKRTGLTPSSGESCGSRIAATTGSPTKPRPSAASVTPSWIAEMYESSDMRICIAFRARTLPASISSCSCVPRTRTNEYSATTKKALTRSRRTNVTSSKPVERSAIRTDSRTYHCGSMNVRVRLFASAREAAGVGHLLLEVPSGTTVQGAIAAISKDHPLVGEIRQMVIARNRDYVGLDAPLADGDELALIPPVSGGA